jgi:hypothetical protein
MRHMTSREDDLMPPPCWPISFPVRLEDYEPPTKPRHPPRTPLEVCTLNDPSYLRQGPFCLHQPWMWDA